MNFLHQRSIRPLVAGTMILGIACSRSEPSMPGLSRVDSAGVAIVAGGQLPLAAAPWVLSAEPAVTIGVQSGDVAYELTGVTRAIRLSNDHIVVANNGTQDVRFYDASGTHLRTVGRDGAGPGEFRLVSWIGRLEHDSIAVYDRRERRITILSADGSFVRTASVQNRDRLFFPVLMGVLNNGVFAAQYPVRLRGGPDAALGMGRDSVVVLTIDREGAVRDTIGVFANRMIEVQMRNVGDNRMRLPGTLPFTPATMVAAGGGVVVVGNTDAVNLRSFNPVGDLIQQLRVRSPVTPVQESHRNYIVDSLRTRYADNLNNPEINLMIRITETVPLPPAFPVFDSIAVDADRHIWIQDYQLPGETTVGWSVFRPDGEAVGHVQGPPGFRATEFGRDYVLGVSVGRLGVERVELYRLSRASG